MCDLLNTEFRDAESRLVAGIAKGVQEMRRYWLRLQNLIFIGLMHPGVQLYTIVNSVAIDIQFNTYWE